MFTTKKTTQTYTWWRTVVSQAAVSLCHTHDPHFCISQIQVLERKKKNYIECLLLQPVTSYIL